MKNIKLTRLLLRLIFVYSCLKVNLSKGQINGDDVRTAEYPDAGFRSQVLVEMKYHWRPLNLPKDNTTRVVKYLQNDFSLDDKHVENPGSGTIISESWILTAAHIFDKNTINFLFNNEHEIFTLMPYTREDDRQYVELEGTVYYVRVMAGQHNKRNEGNRHSVSHVIIHHGYQGNVGNDIALIRLKKPLDLNRPNIERLQLAPFQPRASRAMDCAIAGWGTANNNDESNVLLWAPIRMVELSPNRDNWIEEEANLQERSRLIAVGRRGEPLNWGEPLNYPRASGGPGDSGGGLVCKHDGERYLFGVMYGGKDDDEFEEWGLFGIPTLFTDVFQYKAWIEEEMERELRSESTMFLDMSNAKDWYRDMLEFPLEQLNVYN